MKTSRVSLATLAAGSVGEAFDAEFAKLLANVHDPNASAQITRTITLTIAVKPDERREMGAWKASVKSKLAPERERGGTFFFERDRGLDVALSVDPEQGDLFTGKKAEEPENTGDGTSKVTPLRREEGAAK